MALPYATEDQLNRVEKKLLKKMGQETGEMPTVPTKLSELTNDTGFITEAALTDYALKSELPNTEEFVKEADLPDFDTFALKTEIPQVDGFATKVDVDNLIKTEDTTIQVGNEGHGINLNGSTDRVTYKGSEELAFVSDLDRMPLICTMPFRKVSGYLGDDGTKFSKETVLGWFGVTTIQELKQLVVKKPIYLMYGITLTTNPMYYYIPCQYVAFTAKNKLELITDGLDTNNDKLSRYRIVLTFVLDSEVTVEDTEIAITVDNYIHLPELPEDADTKTYQLKAINGTLTWVE